MAVAPGYREPEPSEGSGFDMDPSAMLDVLKPVGDFEEVGRFGVVGDAITSLEVWIDDDGLVRRLDLATRGDGQDLVSTSVSVRLFDLGEPITIEPPAEPCRLW